MGFLLPLPAERALAFWRGAAAGVARGERAVLVAEDAAGPPATPSSSTAT